MQLKCELQLKCNENIPPLKEIETSDEKWQDINKINNH